MTLRSLTILAVAIAALAAPGAAHAATYTVAAGNGACGGADTGCESLNAAAGAVVAGDTVQVQPGTYNEAPTFPVAGVTVTGSTAAPGVIVTGTITFAGDGSTRSVLEKLVVAVTTGSSPAVGVTGSAGLAVRDAALLSSGGSGLAIAGGQGNEITRTTVASGAAAGRAVDIQTGSVAANLVIDSSILSGGATGAGLSVMTGTSGIAGSAAPVSVTARHVTIAGAANAVVLDASAATGVLSPVGSIAATVTDSIVLGQTATRNNPGLLLLPANSATLTFTRTDRTTAPAALFVNPGRNFHLRADAPAIDKAQITPGDSPTDVDGQARTAGPLSDLGADEFHNTPPTAVIAIKTTNPRSDQPVSFDASGSTDREAGSGGGIVSYRWSFGDGQAETTTTPAVEHTYRSEGEIVAQLVVVDRQGGESAAATVPLKLTDGTPPQVVITKPSPGQTIRRIVTKTRTVRKKGAEPRRVRTRKRRKIAFAGTATDKSGVTGVILTIEKLATRASAMSSAARSGTCTWVDPKRGLVTGRCDKPVLIRARLGAGRWAYNTSTKIRLRAGSYRVSAYGTDRAGAVGNSAAKNAFVKFTLK